MEDKEKLGSAVILYLIHSKSNLLSAISPILAQKAELLKTEDSSFHAEIEAQFETVIRREIAETIATNIQFDPEKVFLIVESLNVPEFIGNFVPEKENV